MRLTIIELAMMVLHRAVERASGQRVDDDGVRLALRCLLPVAGDRQLLVEFWGYAGQLQHANRQASCTTVLASIAADLRAGGHYPTDDMAHRRLLADRLASDSREQHAREAVKRRHYFSPPARRQ